jgi:hypothetical protein
MSNKNRKTKSSSEKGILKNNSPKKKPTILEIDP